MEQFNYKWDDKPFFKDVISGSYKENDQVVEYSIRDTLGDITQMYCGDCVHCDFGEHTDIVYDEVMKIHRAYIEDSSEAVLLDKFKYGDKEYTEDELIAEFEDKQLDFDVNFIFFSGYREEYEVDDGYRYKVDVPEYDNDHLTISLKDLFDYAYGPCGIEKAVASEKEADEEMEK